MRPHPPSGGGLIPGLSGQQLGLRTIAPAETARQSARVIPPVLYLPVCESATGARCAVIRDLTDGRRALLAYTALDRLFDSCGEQQQWVLVALDGIEVIRDDQPFDVIGYDVNVPVSLRSNGRLA